MNKVLETKARAIADKMWGTEGMKDLSEFTIPLDTVISMLVKLCEESIFPDKGDIRKHFDETNPKGYKAEMRGGGYSASYTEWLEELIRKRNAYLNQGLLQLQGNLRNAIEQCESDYDHADMGIYYDDVEKELQQIIFEI